MRALYLSRLELLGQSSLLQHTVSCVAALDRVVNREASAGGSNPYLVIAFALPVEPTASTIEDPLKLWREIGGH